MVFLAQSTQPTETGKSRPNLTRPNSAEPNPRVNQTHGQLCVDNDSVSNNNQCQFK